MYFASDSKVRHVRAVGIFFIGQASINQGGFARQGRHPITKCICAKENSQPTASRSEYQWALSINPAAVFMDTISNDAKISIEKRLEITIPVSNSAF
ncbi:MAG: hypothetical protein AAFR90_10950 [Pseudomonadota bacterium]